MAGPVLSIVIVNWNTRDMLAACLRSVTAQTLVSHEVWVVDNASSDGSAEMVRQDFPDVHLIAHHANSGFAAGNNLALPLCQGHYVLLLNSDTIVHEAALDRMVGFMHANPRVGGLGCKLVNADGSLQPSAHAFYGTWRSLIENRLTMAAWPWRHARTPFLSFWDHTTSRHVDWVCGAALMVRRSVMAEVGLLDDAFFMYAEEIDWQWRMAAAGHAVWFYPGAVITHFGGGSSRGTPARTKRMEQDSRARFVAKHYRAFDRAVYNAKAGMARSLWNALADMRERRGVTP